MFKIEDNKLIYSMRGEKLLIEAHGKNALRVRATRKNSFSERNGALEKNETVCASVTLGDNGAEIVNGKIKATVDQFGKIIFYKNGHFEILLKQVFLKKIYKLI